MDLWGLQVSVSPKPSATPSADTPHNLQVPTAIMSGRMIHGNREGCILLALVSVAHKDTTGMQLDSAMYAMAIGEGQ